MALIIQKFGGTSVADVERIKKVASRVAASHAQGNKLVIVVSAMSGATNNLIKLSQEITDSPSEREMDMLLVTGEQTTIALMAMALHHLGVPATSLTGAQAGILTDEIHTKAKIKEITPQKIHHFLDQGHVVIVAGFQGQNSDGGITTLGRGGSDLTAIALASALKADTCQIFTDVDGVYTADPRLVPHAKKIEEISYDEMLEMAGLGTKVMQARSVEFAKKFDVVFEVRSSFNNNSGTLIKKETQTMEHIVVRGVSLAKDQAKVTILKVPDKPGVAAEIFGQLSQKHINVDMIVQNISEQGTTDITFTLEKGDLNKAREVIAPLVKKIEAREVVCQENVCKLSVVGIGMRSHSGVAATLFDSLSKGNINIQMISTSEIKISIVISQDDGTEALRIVHDAFGLQN